MAILTRVRDRQAAMRRIVSPIATLESGARGAAFAQLLLLAGLRKLEQSIRTEVQFMPITHDILDHEVIGPAIKEGRRQEGISILRRQIEKRLGPLPGWAEERLTHSSIAALEDLSLRVLDATISTIYSEYPLSLWRPGRCEKVAYASCSDCGLRDLPVGGGEVEILT